MTIRVSLLKMVFPSILILFASSARLVAQEKPLLSAPCVAPEYRQFDFWVGDWDAFESDGVTKAAHVRVDRTLDGCTLHEYYEDHKGLKGDSISIYDLSRKVWHQSWVTNQGQFLSIEGQMQADAMVLSGSFRAVNGEETLVRGTWKPQGNGARETAVTSTDRGRTCKPWFDLLFRPHGSAPTNNDDAKTVASLDTEYQAAVKENDAATMDRILADDFVLVTGSGKVFSKADLIEEARAVRTTYERQDDTERVIRIWGDTAVITAKLWEKGVTSGKPFDSTLWFSDTYVRTPTGWRYVFGQASLPLGNVEKPEASFPPGYATTRTGDVHDFDYFAGGWTTRQRRLKTRGVGSTEWEEVPATLCMSLYLDGMATVDELYFPTKGRAGLTLRTFDLERRQWSISWVSSASGKMDVPVVGGFDGSHGEFYGEDQDNGRPVKVCYTWNKLDRDNARWEQAFSYDNHTWETNWTADFVRADPKSTCEAGRPKR